MSSTLTLSVTPDPGEKDPRATRERIAGEALRGSARDTPAGRLQAWCRFRYQARSRDLEWSLRSRFRLGQPAEYGLSAAGVAPSVHAVRRVSRGTLNGTRDHTRSQCPDFRQQRFRLLVQVEGVLVQDRPGTAYSVTGVRRVALRVHQVTLG